MRRGLRLTSGLITGAALAAALVTATAMAAPAMAARAQIPRPAAAGSDELSAISCTSTHYCIAVGAQQVNRLGAGTSLALAWNGRGWQELPTPATSKAGSSLAGIDCLSARRCIAVGSIGNGSKTLAERWNGTTWLRLPMPTHDGALHAVSCTSARRCMAVGSDHECELAEQWNGTSWRVLSTPSPCGPPQSGGLIGVTCLSGSSCQAVGNYMPDNETGLTLAESWNGTKWTRRGTSSPGDLASLNSVSCVSAARCMAVGSGFPVESLGQAAIAESWNGRAWTLLAPSRRGAPASLNGVACLRAAWCMAVGSFTRGGALLPQAQTWNGGIWQMAPGPDAPGTLSGLSCPAQDRCLAVGSSGPDDFAALWNGTRWRSVTSVPSP